MKILIDAFGGDNAPKEILKGCAIAKKEYPELKLYLSGNREQIERVAKEEGIEKSWEKIFDAKSVITADDNPMELRRSKKDSSMTVGFNALRAGEADAFVSAGSTAALAVGSSMIAKRIPGIKRAALAPVMPSEKGPFMLLDAGANIDLRAEMLFQFGWMGSIYAREILGIKNPRVGLANIGAEETKGPEALQQAYLLLKNEPSINFVGNVEARDIPLGSCDVVVADGVSGNMILKSMEGMGLFFIHAMKDMFYASVKTKFAALMLKKQLLKFKNKMDYTEYGGAVFMGISSPVIKAHGSSDANAIKNAIRQAKNCVEKQIPQQIANALNQINAEKGEENAKD